MSSLESKLKQSLAKVKRDRGQEDESLEKEIKRDEKAARKKKKSREWEHDALTAEEDSKFAIVPMVGVKYRPEVRIKKITVNVSNTIQKKGCWHKAEFGMEVEIPRDAEEDDIAEIIQQTQTFAKLQSYAQIQSVVDDLYEKTHCPF